MATSVDTVVVGGGSNGLVAAIALARAGSKVLVVERNAELGGALTEIEFAPGFRAAPLAADVGYLDPEIARGVGLPALAEVASDPPVTSIAEGRSLHLYRDLRKTADGIKAFSAKDGERWAAFATRMHGIAGFLAALYRLPPPQLDGNSIGDLLGLAGLGKKLKGMGKVEMVEVLRTIPLSVAELVEDWFESDRLRGIVASLGVTDICQGPMSGGTAFSFLHGQVGAGLGVFGERLRPAGGVAAFSTALADRARAAGVTITTGRTVAQVVVRGDRVAGVLLDNGEEIGCREVVSSLDPRRSFLEILDPVHLDPDFIHAVQQIRFRGVTSKVLLALDSLPSLPGLGAEQLGGAVVLAPSVRYLEQAYDATKYGTCSEQPMLSVRFPSVLHQGLAPAGKHVAVLSMQYTPYRLRDGSWASIQDGAADRAIALLDQHWPGFSARIRQRTVLSPVDLEQRFGLREGALSQGEMMLDQILFMRPVPEASRYATPIPGYYLTGSGTHPGGGIVGRSGWLAAQAVLAGRGR